MRQMQHLPPPAIALSDSGLEDISLRAEARWLRLHRICKKEPINAVAAEAPSLDIKSTAPAVRPPLLLGISVLLRNTALARVAEGAGYTPKPVLRPRRLLFFQSQQAVGAISDCRSYLYDAGGACTYNAIYILSSVELAECSARI